MDRSSNAAGSDPSPTTGAGVPTVESEPAAEGAPTTPVAAVRERVAQATASAGSAVTSAVGAAAAAKDTAVERATQTGAAITATVSHAAGQAAEATGAAAGQVVSGAAQVAGNVSAGATSAKVTATNAAQQGLARVRVVLLEKPAVLLGGAFALGIVIARLV